MTNRSSRESDIVTEILDVRIEFRQRFANKLVSLFYGKEHRKAVGSGQLAVGGGQFLVLLWQWAVGKWDGGSCELAVGLLGTECRATLLLVLVESARGIVLRSLCGLRLSTRLSPTILHSSHWYYRHDFDCDGL